MEVLMASRRNVLKVLGMLPAAGYLATSPTAWSEVPKPRLPQRLLGRTGRWVTPLALGIQASVVGAIAVIQHGWDGPDALRHLAAALRHARIHLIRFFHILNGVHLNRINVRAL